MGGIDPLPWVFLGLLIISLIYTETKIRGLKKHYRKHCHLDLMLSQHHRHLLGVHGRIAERHAANQMQEAHLPLRYWSSPRFLGNIPQLVRDKQALRKITHKHLKPIRKEAS